MGKCMECGETNHERSPKGKMGSEKKMQIRLSPYIPLCESENGFLA